MLKNHNVIMDVELPHEVAADLTIRAGRENIPTCEYLGNLVLAGAYGQSHPTVVAWRNRGKLGVSGTETPPPAPAKDIAPDTEAS